MYGRSRSPECGRARASKALIAMIQNHKSIFTHQERAPSPPPPPLVTTSGSSVLAEQGQGEAGSKWRVESTWLLVARNLAPKGKNPKPQRNTGPLGTWIINNADVKSAAHRKAQ